MKKKVKEVSGGGIESDSSMSSLKKSLDELEKERIEAEKKWEEIQKQEKVCVCLNLEIFTVIVFMVINYS